MAGSGRHRINSLEIKPGSAGVVTLERGGGEGVTSGFYPLQGAGNAARAGEVVGAAYSRHMRLNEVKMLREYDRTIAAQKIKEQIS